MFLCGLGGIRTAASHCLPVLTDCPMTKGYIMEIITRKEALALGLKRYFTGRPCPHGHVCERLASNYVCIECKNRENVKWAKENPEKAALIRKEWLNKNKEENAKRYSDWYAKNPDYHKGWRERNRKAVNLTASKYRAKNPKKVLALSALRRARKSGSSGKHTAADIEKILKSQKHKCANCLTSIKKSYHVDHIMPLALGGFNGPENLQCLCPTCNLKKHAKHPIDWAQENGRLL